MLFGTPTLEMGGTSKYNAEVDNMVIVKVISGTSCPPR
jgi:hypothetical protein